jgi:hypothetical protein
LLIRVADDADLRAISISKAYLNFDVYGAANYLTFIRLRVNEFTPWGGDV